MGIDRGVIDIGVGMCLIGYRNMAFLFRVQSYGLAVFFFNDTATTEIYTLSLHDALPI